MPVYFEVRDPNLAPAEIQSGQLRDDEAARLLLEGDIQAIVNGHGIPADQTFSGKAIAGGLQLFDPEGNNVAGFTLEGKLIPLHGLTIYPQDALTLAPVPNTPIERLLVDPDPYIGYQLLDELLDELCPIEEGQTVWFLGLMA